VDPGLEQEVLEILHAVRKDGDKALLHYTRTFDAAALDPSRLTLEREEILQACETVDADFLRIIRTAISNIESFHRQQLRSSYFLTKPDGTFLGQRVSPVSSAGLYIPGGRGGETLSFSSVLMNGVPARLAGVRDIALATPPRRDGSINPYLLAAAREVGVSRIHPVGSAWAIAALAYGTESVPRVDVVVGPGNVYVTLAKRWCPARWGSIFWPVPARSWSLPTGANPDYLAADLLSQAEHDSMASGVLITLSKPLAQRTIESLEKQLNRLPRRSVARESLTRYGAIFLVEDLDQAAELAGRIAPEHLELQVRDPWSLVGKIEHAGAIFLGENTPEAVGDYFAGPNHVLPTAGTARFRFRVWGWMPS